MPTLCVFCSSSNTIADTYPPVADALGRAMAHRDCTLIYGGGRVGLMGVVARAVHEEDGTVIGVIPERLRAREGIAYEVADELIVTDTMRERKHHMFDAADAFIVLPGGFGTLEEFLEALTLKQLGYHGRPIALVNPDGFFDPLLDFFQQLHREQFARSAVREHIHVAATAEEALNGVLDGIARTSA